MQALLAIKWDIARVQHVQVLGGASRSRSCGLVADYISLEMGARSGRGLRWRLERRGGTAQLTRRVSSPERLVLVPYVASEFIKVLWPVLRVVRGELASRGR